MYCCRQQEAGFADGKRQVRTVRLQTTSKYMSSTSTCFVTTVIETTGNIESTRDVYSDMIVALHLLDLQTQTRSKLHSN